MLRICNREQSVAAKMHHPPLCWRLRHLMVNALFPRCILEGRLARVTVDIRRAPVAELA